MMLEAVVFMGVIMVVCAGFIGLNNNVHHSQRHAQAVDIAAQSAKGLMEKVKATPWDKIGMWTGDISGTPATHVGSTAGAFVRIPGATRPVGVRASGPGHVHDGESTKVKVDLRMFVTWNGGCQGGCTSTTPAGNYGSKTVTIKATFTPLGRTQQVVVYRFDLDAPINEAEPWVTSSAATASPTPSGALS